ncbi:MAG: methyltransferase domain-containing protein [Planctomycetota bacterium]|nr:methyltransferase domain-containing protein [Planctomycetota bacterium]
MQRLPDVKLSDVQATYTGPEADLWLLLMGEQVHIGGFRSSMDLAQQAGIHAGQEGVDLCCCIGAGMRFLVRFCGVARMRGVDATARMVEMGRARCAQEGSGGKIEFIQADVCRSGLPASCADFVWGEDAWCYVEDKATLIAEAARIVKPGGTIAFTDWVEGAGLAQAEAARYMRFMKFPSVLKVSEYSDLLVKNGCQVVRAADTGRFPPHVDLYLSMVDKQLTYDALRIIGFDTKMMEALSQEMVFMQGLAHAGKIAQGLFVARKN